MLYDPFQLTSFSPSLSLSLPLYVSFSASLSCVCPFLFPLSICVSSSSLPLLPSSVLPLWSVLTPEVVFLCNQSPEAMENDTTFLRCRSFLGSSCFSPTARHCCSHTVTQPSPSWEPSHCQPLHVRASLAPRVPGHLLHLIYMFTKVSHPQWSPYEHKTAILRWQIPSFLTCSPGSCDTSYSTLSEPC